MYAIICLGPGSKEMFSMQGKYDEKNLRERIVKDVPLVKLCFYWTRMLRSNEKTHTWAVNICVIVIPLFYDDRW